MQNASHARHNENGEMEDIAMLAFFGSLLRHPSERIVQVFDFSSFLFIVFFENHIRIVPTSRSHFCATQLSE